MKRHFGSLGIATWALIELGCAGSARRPTLEIDDVHASETPIVISRRVAIDERPCQRAAYAVVGALNGGMMISPTGPSEHLGATITRAEGSGAIGVEHLAVRSAELRVSLRQLATRTVVPMRTQPGAPDDRTEEQEVVRADTDLLIPVPTSGRGPGNPGGSTLASSADLVDALEAMVNLAVATPTRAVLPRLFRGVESLQGEAVHASPDVIARRCAEAGAR